MVYSELNQDWTKSDPKYWDTYSNTQEVIRCTQDNFLDSNQNNLPLETQFNEWESFSVYCKDTKKSPIVISGWDDESLNTTSAVF